MASFTLQDQPEFDPIPAEEMLEAEIIDCKVQPGPFWIDKNDHSKGKQDQVSFRFKIVEEGEYEGRTIFGNTPPWFNRSSKCTLRLWVQEILGLEEADIFDSDPPFEFDTDNLIGSFCRILIGNYEKKDDAGEILAVKDFVDDVLRLESDLLGADEVF